MKGYFKLTVMFFLAGIFILTASAVNSQHSQSIPVRVACVGNSITYGMKLEDRESQSYPSVLQKLLGNNYEVGNFGKNGSTLLYKGHRPYIEQTEFKKALEFNPDIVVIHLGVNDTDPRDYPDYSDYFIKDYISLIDSFKNKNPKVRIILANLSPLNAKHYRFKSGTRAWRDSIRSLLPIIAKVSGAELIDFGEVLKHKQNLIPDGIHPDKNGAKLLAEEVYGAISGDFGGLKLPEIYGNNMVLQRYRPINIQGKANVGDTIKVRLGNNNGKAVADNTGNWHVILPPMKEQTGLSMSITNGEKTFKFKDIAIGEVWIASGQSNMEFQLRNISTAEEDLNNVNDSLLRLFNMVPVAHTNAKEWSEEQKLLVDNLHHYKTSQWQNSDSASGRTFSAVAWHFAKMLRDSLNVPVGIIANSVGGSPTEAWIDIETLEHNIPEILVDWRTNDYLQPWVQKRISENIGDIKEKGYHRHPYEPSYLFSSGIFPLANFPIAGVVWYQGESNAHNIEVHETLFPSLLESWRKYWAQPELPFIFVQLSSIDRPSWPQFRDSQRRLCQKQKNVWMVVSSDLGDSLDVHPKNKRPIGERMGRQALNHVYSMTHITPQGPTIREARLKTNDELILEFDYSEGLTTSDGRDPMFFELAGDNGMFIEPDDIKIENNKIIITGMNNDNPQYVRYGWQPYTRANLINRDGLPASTFKIKVSKDATNEIETGFESGLSGSFIGVLNGNLIVAGGCNFPDNPMAPDSKKKFYEGIYKLSETTEGKWTAERIGSLPKAMAYGSSVSIPEGIVMIGGADANNSYNEMLLLTEKENEIKVIDLPFLPVKVDNANATYLKGKIYLAGGNMDGTPSNRLFVFDTKKMESGWKEMRNFPGNPRVQPIVSNGSPEGKDFIYIWGGFATKGKNQEATLNTDGLKYDIKNNKWEKITGPVDKEGKEISVGGGASTILPDGKIVVIGGVNKNIFLEALKNQTPDYLSHPVDWYNFNPNVFVFNPRIDAWSIDRELKTTARAGAGLVSNEDGEIFVVGGEIKPRIRTADIIKMKIE